jgi:hypothetical protein
MIMNRKISMLLLSFSFIAASLVLLYQPVEATSGSFQYRTTTCQDLNRNVNCNDCTSGSKTCYEHTCNQCLGLPEIGG